MIGIQIGLIIFLFFILAIICQDELKKHRRERKSTKLDRFWNDGKERRRSIRIDTAIDVLYEVVSTSKAKKRPSMSRNISLGGMNLALNEKLLPGTSLNLQLKLPECHKEISAQGNVVWVREIAERFTKHNEQKLFATGVKFTQIKPNDENILYSFIEQNIIKNVPGQTQG